jgi:hypothetical protein
MPRTDEGDPSKCAGKATQSFGSYLSPLCCPLTLIFSAISISRRIASEREGLSFCCLAQLSISDLSAAESRSAETGVSPVRGRPRFFRTTGIDFRILLYYVKGKPVESGNFPPALTQATEVSHGPGWLCD